MNHGNPPGDDDSGDESSPNSSAGDDDPHQHHELTLRIQEFKELIADARDPRVKNESRITLFERAAAFAQEWMLAEEARIATTELSRVYIERRKFSQALSAINRLLEQQTAELGARHASLARIKMLRGECLLRMHRLEPAIADLRAAVLQYQTADGVTEDDLLESLCILATAYRHNEQNDKARSCLKQAYAILSPDDKPNPLRIRVVEEVANIMFAYKRMPAARAAFEQVVQMKRELYGDSHEENIDAQIQLGMCYFGLQQWSRAEEAFVRAVDIERFNKADPKRLAFTLEKLAGVYRVNARFSEATLVEQCAGEILGRAIKMRLGYLKSFEAGVAAHRRHKFDVAADCYKAALNHLEFLGDKRGADRIPVLARLLQLALVRKRSVQVRALEAEIELGLAAMFPFDSAPEALLRLGRLFKVLGLYSASEACYTQTEIWLRRSADPQQFLAALEEHARLLKCMNWLPELERTDKLIRRLHRLWDDEDEVVEAVLAIEKCDSLLADQLALP